MTLLILTSETPNLDKFMHRNLPSSRDQKIINLLQATGLFNIISKIELYNRIILAYDKDQDQRLKKVVERIKTPYLKEDLIVAYECDGHLTLIWKDSVPSLFSQGQSVAANYFGDDPDGNIDYWYILHSLSGRAIEHKALLEIMNESTGFDFSLN